MVYTVGQRPWEEKELARGRRPLPSSPPRREPEEGEEVADDEGVEDALPASGATAPTPTPTTTAAASNSASTVPQLHLNTTSGALTVPPAVTALVVATIPSTDATEWPTGTDSGSGAEPARSAQATGPDLILYSSITLSTYHPFFSSRLINMSRRQFFTYLPLEDATFAPEAVTRMMSQEAVGFLETLHESGKQAFQRT
ncbi:hypothetical protein FDECE_16632 [Fusarium decemcellulare]|nr:hypothetical protein FDECE_16632 [Fusarium decemcellulare]